MPDYSRTGDFKCSKCPPLWLNIIISILMFSALIIFTIIVIFFTISASNRNKFKINVLMRMLMNHVQIMVITVSFELNWPSALSKMLGSTKPIADISTQFISFD